LNIIIFALGFISVLVASYVDTYVNPQEFVTDGEFKPVFETDKQKKEWKFITRTMVVFFIYRLAGLFYSIYLVFSSLTSVQTIISVVFVVFHLLYIGMAFSKSDESATVPPSILNILDTAYISYLLFLFISNF